MLLEVSRHRILEVDAVAPALRKPDPMTRVEVADLTRLGPARDGFATGVTTELVFYGEHDTDHATKDARRIVLAGRGFVVELDHAGAVRWLRQGDFTTGGVELLGAHVGVLVARPVPQLVILGPQGAPSSAIAVSRGARFLGRQRGGVWVGDGTRALFVDGSGRPGAHLAFDHVVVAAAALSDGRTAFATGDSIDLWHIERGIVERLHAPGPVRSIAAAGGVLFAAMEREIATWTI